MRLCLIETPRPSDDVWPPHAKQTGARCRARRRVVPSKFGVWARLPQEGYTAPRVFAQLDGAPMPAALGSLICPSQRLTPRAEAEPAELDCRKNLLVCRTTAQVPEWAHFSRCGRAASSRHIRAAGRPGAWHLRGTASQKNWLLRSTAVWQASMMVTCHADQTRGTLCTSDVGFRGGRCQPVIWPHAVRKPPWNSLLASSRMSQEAS